MKNALSKQICRGWQKKGTLLTAVIVLSLVAGTMMLPRNAEASCFYNYAESGEIHVHLNSYLIFSNDWDIKPGEHKCRPGKGGNAYIGHAKRDLCFFKVENHGWAELTHTGNAEKAIITIFDENGNKTGICKLTW